MPFKNPEDRKAYMAAWRVNNAAKTAAYARKSKLKNRYGMTPEQFDDLLVEQEGLCAICQSEIPTAVDHDHTTEAVRGLLCSQCNSGLGMFHDNIESLTSAILYLQKHSGPEASNGSGPECILG